MSTAIAFAPATHARPVHATRLLVVDVARGSVAEVPFTRFADLLAPGDVVVVNDAATLPASVFGETSRGEPIEVRMLALPNETRECDAVIFGAGDWHTPTEHRPAPPALAVGMELIVGGLEATVVALHGPRRIRVRFEKGRGEAVAALYRVGRPVQYAHIDAPLPLWDVQNIYAAEPWAAEMPSAGRPLDFAALDALRKRGIVIGRLTHGAGLSSIGDASLDASLPWVERYRIPVETAGMVHEAKRAGKRIVAIGTSVVRALESAARPSETGEPTSLAPLRFTSLRIDANYRPRVVTALLTGMHDATTSHADLVSAFVPGPLMTEASRFASHRGFLGHELGDSCLILDA